MTLLKSNKLLFLFIFIFPLLSRAQQALEPLNYNQYLGEYSKEFPKDRGHSKANELDTIQINLALSRVIFKDDFSSYKGWPTPTLWADNFVYINNSFGDLPVSLGVATFDGMDPAGKPYNNATPSAYGKNDDLTSLPINLSDVDLNDPNIDTLYLSFFYQPQGMNPFGTEPGDSLILQFYDVAANLWKTAWKADGQPLKPFRQVTLPIEPVYYQNGFQFRFSNYGNQTGNVDHWHIDYVYLTSNTKRNHAEIEDMAIRNNVFTLLDEYTAMPWWHYNTADMASEVSLNYYYFNKFKPKSPDIKSWVELYESDGSQIAQVGTTSPEFTIGFIGNKKINFPFNASATINYPVATADVTNFFNYKIYYSYNIINSDDTPSNDTIIQNQIFGSYYAYDDGLPEAGYGVFGAGNKLAYRFDIGNEVDTLTALDLFFTPIVRDRSSERFQLVVWGHDANNDRPSDDALYRKPVFDRPRYSDINIYKGLGNFIRYSLDADVIVTGIFYVGWEKISEERLNIGYDVNTNSQDNIYVNVGDIWSVSDSSGGVVPGSLMMRPVFRGKKDPVVGTDDSPEVTTSSWSIFPNPARDILNFNSSQTNENQPFDILIYDLNGRVVQQSRVNGRSTDIGRLGHGMYVIRILDLNGIELQRTKFVRQP